MQPAYRQGTSFTLRLVIIFSFCGLLVADNATTSQRCPWLNGASFYARTTMLQDLCAVYLKMPGQSYTNGVSNCYSVVNYYGPAVCRVGFITTLDDVAVLINSDLIQENDRFYVGLIQTDTSGAASEGWSWDDFNGMRPATPLWATGEPSDTNNTASFAAYEGGNGLVDVNNNTFVPTGFFCQCDFPATTTSLSSIASPAATTPVTPTTTATTTTVKTTAPTAAPTTTRVNATAVTNSTTSAATTRTSPMVTSGSSTTTTPTGQICGWQKTQSGVQGYRLNTNSMRVFRAINQKNCKTLCTMNVLQPKCGAYAYAPTIQFFSGNNCYIFTPLSSDTTFVAGVFDLYQYNC